MRVWAILAGLMLSGCQPAPRTSGGIVSTNPCADQMLIGLVQPERIAAISHYSQEPGASSIPPAVARRFRSTAGTAEEVIALRPDLVVTSSFTPPATLAAYKRARLTVVTLGEASSIADSERQVMQLADATGMHYRGLGMVARIERALAAAAPPAGDRRRPGTLLYLGGDLANAGPTLLTELETRTGLHDASADYGLTHTGDLPLEAIIEHPPQLILTPDLTDRPTRLRADVLQYRTHLALFPHQLSNCGGPTIAAAAATLANIRRQVLR